MKTAAQTRQPIEQVTEAVKEAAKEKVNDIIASNCQRQIHLQNLETQILTLAANINAAKYQNASLGRRLVLRRFTPLT